MSHWNCCKKRPSWIRCLPSSSQPWPIGWPSQAVTKKPKHYLQVIDLDPEFAANYSNLSGFYAGYLGRFADALKWVSIARELILNAYPGWNDPAQWAHLIQADIYNACLVAGVMEKTGDESRAHELIEQIIEYYHSLPLFCFAKI